MMLGYIFLFSSMLAFGILGIFHKVADHPECRPKVIAVILLFWGGLLTTLYTLLLEAKGLQFPPRVVAIGAMGGVCSSLALFAFQAGLRFGKISTSWLVTNLCVSIPVLLSIFYFREPITRGKIVGLALVLTAIFLLWWDKQVELRRSGAETSDTHTTVKSKWLPLMLLAFVLGGMAASSQKILVEAGGKDYAWQFYVILYWSGFLLMAAITLIGKTRPNRREFLTALVMGCVSVIGNVCIVLALSKIDGSIAYPIGNGGSLFLVVLAGLVFFREKLTPAGIAGITLGITAILILALS